MELARMDQVSLSADVEDCRGMACMDEACWDEACRAVGAGVDCAGLVVGEPAMISKKIIRQPIFFRIVIFVNLQSKVCKLHIIVYFHRYMKKWFLPVVVIVVLLLLAAVYLLIPSNLTVL